MRKDKISLEFIDYLRLNLATTVWNFDNENGIAIIPRELTHNYLLSHFDIDNSILGYYCLPSARLLVDFEYQNLIETGYIRKRETTLCKRELTMYRNWQIRMYEK